MNKSITTPTQTTVKYPRRDKTPTATRPIRKDIGPRIAWIKTLAGCMTVLFFCKRIESNAPESTARPGPDFDIVLWFEGVYQEKLEQYLQKDWLVGRQLTSIKNQMDFRLYKKLNMHGYLLGNKDYLVEETNINSYLGKDYLGEELIARQFKQIRTVADSLKRHNIDLLLLFAPNKEFFMPEVIPGKYLTVPKGKTNYETYVAMSKAYGLDHIDLKPVLHGLSKKYKYPLYPKLGTHLSFFSECMVADTVIKYMERMRGIDLPKMFWDSIEYPAKARMRDEDGIAKCGLLYPPKSFPMAYPRMGYTTTTLNDKIKVLGIGDSYFRGFIYQGVTRYIFGLGDFWYYYSSVDGETGKVGEVWEHDLKTKLEENNVVIVYYSSAGCVNFGNGFFEDAYQMYTAPASYAAKVKKEKPVRQNMKLIHDDEDLLNEAIALSRQLNVSLDSAIRLKAIKMIE